MTKGFLFFDIDGTLVDSERTGIVYPGTLEALRIAAENGYKSFICTGRNLGGSERYLLEHMDGIVFSDGAGLYIRGEDLILDPLSERSVRDLIQSMKDTYHGELLMASVRECFASEKQYQDMEALAARSANERNASPEEILKEFGIRRIEEYDGQPILEIDIAFPSSETEKAWLANMPEEFEFINTTASYGRGGYTAGEITRKGVTKGNGALRMVEHFHGDPKTAYGFGDAMNDASMILALQHGIAMGNAAEELKELADYVTADIRDDGIWKAMKHYGII